MIKLLVPVIGVVILSGCASTSNDTVYQEPAHQQYCDTRESVTIKNGETTDSVTELECSDNLLDKVVMNRTAIDGKSCNFFKNNFVLGGRNVSKIGIWCTLPNGNHVIVDDDIHN